MELHFLGRFPVNYKPYGELEELSDVEITKLNSLGFDEVWYWYSTAPYEGSGQMLIRKGNLYDLHDASHCSCYGPIGGIYFDGKPLDELISCINKEYMENEVKDLFELAGYKF